MIFGLYGKSTTSLHLWVKIQQTYSVYVLNVMLLLLLLFSGLFMCKTRICDVLGAHISPVCQAKQTIVFKMLHFRMYQSSVSFCELIVIAVCGYKTVWWCQCNRTMSDLFII